MSRYVLKLTVPAKTTEGSPASTQTFAIEPIAKRVTLVFPNGCAGKVGAMLSNRGKQIYPSNAGARWIRDNNREVDSGAIYETLYGPPYYLELIAFNEDQINPHTIEARVDVEMR